MPDEPHQDPAEEQEQRSAHHGPTSPKTAKDESASRATTPAGRVHGVPGRTVPVMTRNLVVPGGPNTLRGRRSIEQGPLGSCSAPGIETSHLNARVSPWVAS